MGIKRFMIGQFDRYNEAKQKRDFRHYFFGVEACILQSEKDILELKKESIRQNFELGVHFPLRANQWRLRDPQYLSRDSQIKQDSYDYMDREFQFISEIGVSYILLHYPKPVILDDKVDWSSWRFADKTEYCFESNYSFEEFKAQSEQFFEWLSLKGYEYNFIPVLELDAVNQYIYKTDILEKLLNIYDNIKLCLDIGRIHLQDMIDPIFNGFNLVERFARFAEVIHLWNVKVDTNVTSSHYPTLPHLNPEDGWADVNKYLNLISKNTKECKVLFEHRSDLISDEELENCYNWISSILTQK